MSRLPLLRPLGHLPRFKWKGGISKGRTFVALLLFVFLAVILSLVPAVACSSLTVTDNGGPVPAALYDPAVVNVDGADHAASQIPLVLNFPNNNPPVIAYQYYDCIAGATAGSRYLWTGTVLTYEGMGAPEAKPISAVFTPPSAGWSQLTASYKLQYLVTFVAGTGGASTPGAGSCWYDNASSTSISASPDSSHTFLRWSLTGGVLVANQYDPNTTLIVAGSGTIEPVFAIASEQIDFLLVGVGVDAAGTVLTLDGSSLEGPSFNFTLSLERSSVHAFAWSSPVSGSAGTRYVWSSSSGLSAVQSGFITIPSGSASLTAFYRAQCYVTITAGAGGAVNAISDWHDASSSILLAATPSAGYRFLGWVTTGGVSVADPGSPTAALTIDGPGSVEAVFEALPVNISFSQSGVGMDFLGTTINVDGSPLLRADLTKVFSWALGSNHSFAWLSPLAVSVDKQYVWTSTAGLSSAQSGSITVSVAGSVEGSYKVQYYVTISAGSGGNVNWTTGWYDAASPVSIRAKPNPLYGFKGWVTTGGVSISDPNSPSASMTVSAAGTIQATFELLPVTVSFNQSGVGSDFVGTALNVDGTPILLSHLAINYSWAIGSNHSFSWLSPLTVSADKRYTWSSTSGLTAAQTEIIAVPSEGGAINANYRTQYNVMISAVGGGTVDRGSGWYDASSPILVAATPSSGYAFKSWITTGGISVSNTNSAVATMTIVGAGTLQATFELLPIGVTFMQSGIGTDFTGEVLEVDGAPVQLSELPKVYSWTAGNSHNFSWLSPLIVFADGRYIWVSTSGLSSEQAGSLTVPSGSGYVGGAYKAQYYIRITAGAGGSVNASGSWLDDFSTLHVTAAPTAYYAFKMWVTTGNVSVSDPYSPTVIITVTGAGSVEASFELMPVEISFAQSGIGIDYGGVILEVDGVAVQLSELTKSFSWAIGSNHSFSWLSPLMVTPEVRYRWSATSGFSSLQAGTIEAPSVAGSLVGSYVLEYSVSAGSTAGGITNLPTAGWYAEGKTGFASAVPASGYRFANWTTTGGVGVANSSAASTIFMVNGPGTIRANFISVPDIVTVTVRSSSGGGTTPSGANGYKVGSTVALTASPSLGYEFFGWEVDGNATLADLQSPSTILTVWGEATVTASFGQLEVPSYGILFQSTIGGTVSPSGSGDYAEGASVTIVATPTEGYRFVGWDIEGDGVIAEPLSTPAVLIVSGPATVTATFEAIGAKEYTVAFLASEGGIVSPAGSINYSGVVAISITATPEDGHLFSAWDTTGAVVVENATSSTTVITVRGHGTVTANFLSADMDLPIAAEFYPANGSTVSGGPVRIHISFRDGMEIDTSSVVLKVDGIEVSGAQVTAGGVDYNASLGAGAHRVELTAKDGLGNTRVATWALFAYEPLSMSWELYAAVMAEIVFAGVIVYLWWRGRGPAAGVPQAPKKPIVH